MLAAKIAYMQKVWKLKPEIPQAEAEKLSAFPELVQQLLYNRGFTEKKEVEEFLDTAYEKLHDPFLFKDMQKAVDRIWLAIEGGEKICIYGDYDADAVTANAVLQQTFRYLGVEVMSYIPDRFTEGYGVNMEALLKIKDEGSKIIITVDCGTNSLDAAEFCEKNNIDFIITDHHEIIGEVPNSYALINPKNPSDNYPYSEITGVGVAFKLACAILSQKEKVIKCLSFRASAAEPRNPLNSVEEGSLRSSSDALRVGRDDRKYIEGYEKWLLDLVAIGTVADCHSLLGENRILVKYGLKVLQKTRWVGLRALMNSAGVDFNRKPADTYTLGFVVAPRLNAAGRLEHANVALHLLMEKDPVSAQQKAVALEEINSRRQKLTERVMSEAKGAAELISDRKVLVLMGEDWPKGIVGLVAGRISDAFGKPAIVLSQEENEATGSARTVGEFNVVEALKYAGEHLVRFGGHKQAAGLTLKTEDFEKFYMKVLEYADKNLSEEDLSPVLHLEAELGESDLQATTYQLLANFEPFGVGNFRPKFFISNLKITSLRTVGATQQHLQLKFQKGAVSIDSIAFNQGFLEKSLKVGDTVEVAAELIEDSWNGRKNLKLRIIEIKY